MDIDSFALGVLTGAIIPILLWLFKPDRVRKKIGLEEPEPYYVKDPLGNSIQNDPTIGSTYKIEMPQWVEEEQIPIKLQEGFSYFLTPDGRKCKYLAKWRNEKNMFLIKKPSK